MRSLLVAFIISATFGALLWGLYQGTQAVVRGDISAGHLGQTVVYVIILVSSVAVLSEVYGDLLRAAGATERLMELLSLRSPIASPARPVALAATRGGSSVALRDVTFRYPSRPQHATLSHFNLDVAPGETVALVGPERRRQEHGVPAAAALLRRRRRRRAARRRAGEGRGAARAARAHRHRAAGQRDLLGRCDGEHPLRPPGGQRRRGDRGREGRVRARLHHGACPRATRPFWASAACACRAASASASASRARC